MYRHHVESVRRDRGETCKGYTDGLLSECNGGSAGVRGVICVWEGWLGGRSGAVGRRIRVCGRSANRSVVLCCRSPSQIWR